MKREKKRREKNLLSIASSILINPDKGNGIRNLNINISSLGSLRPASVLQTGMFPNPFSNPAVTVFEHHFS